MVNIGGIYHLGCILNGSGLRRICVRWCKGIKPGPSPRAHVLRLFTALLEHVTGSPSPTLLTSSISNGSWNFSMASVWILLLLLTHLSISCDPLSSPPFLSLSISLPLYSPLFLLDGRSRRPSTLSLGVSACWIKFLLSVGFCRGTCFAPSLFFFFF